MRLTADKVVRATGGRALSGKEHQATEVTQPGRKEAPREGVAESDEFYLGKAGAFCQCPACFETVKVGGDGRLVCQTCGFDSEARSGEGEGGVGDRGLS